MKDVQFYRWWIPDPTTGKQRLSSWKMNEDYAVKTYPGCVKDEGSVEVRFIAETDAERIEKATSLHSMIKRH